MVKIYGTSSEVAEPSERSTPNVTRQLTLALSVVALALVVSCALIATAQLQSEETVLYGLGSGEEQEGANAIATTFKTFDAEDDYVKETLGEDYYVDKFKAILDDDAYGKNVKEVKVAVDEAKAEHDILKVFAEGADAGEFGAAP
eukprot:CAMPEP_0113676722 /NCGR_PEP_ID=MMETSP0038_2-20120614/8818_1 /TAXON_ID=2898 /ORGANISM="Cryptomonas paramecium" /LENGTH=144 /DNA_ID=CAMNT_0000593817 /DNA_START=73 /DNA_END=507 /DNA_ORIENTATION=+ /assembly_acc=CAM_ASM_000170